MNENYIMLNGKRVDLTEDQIEKLGFKVEKDYFERLQNGQRYYYICGGGDVSSLADTGDSMDDKYYNVANYCTDISMMHQRALHETLSRLLWRFSMQNDGDKIDWKNRKSCKFHIYFDYNEQEFAVNQNSCYQMIECVYFNTRGIAQRAIDEIILPFMKKHPEFVM